MAYDKVVDSAQLDGALTATADAIRGKTGGTAQIAWDASNGFAAAIAAIAAGGNSSGIGVESGTYTPSEDIRWLDLEVSQEAHDGCLLMLITCDEADLPGLEDITAIVEVYSVCRAPFYLGQMNGFNCYVPVRKITTEANANLVTGMNNYSGGISIEGSTIRFGAGHPYGWYRAGTTYHWYVYYSKGASA